MTLICKECGNERNLGRRLCDPCNKKRLLIIATEKYKTQGRYLWDKNCLACNNSFKAIRKAQDLCGNCYKCMKVYSSQAQSDNNYVFTKIIGRTQHRDLVEEILGRKLDTDEVIHHVDIDPKNNSVDNLMVLSRSDHTKLHKFLDLQRVIWEKSQDENHGNCWKPLIVPMTTAWLETTSANVIKIWEIGQSAAEPLKQICQEEGSETTLVTS